MGRPDPVGPLPPRPPARIGGYGGSRPALPVEVPGGPAADVAPRTETRLPEVRYHTLDFVIPGREGRPMGLVMCLRCGCPVLAMETARHDAAHIIEAGGYIAPGAWALIDRPVGF